jgi:biopolymer transport protein TolQ
MDFVFFKSAGWQLFLQMDWMATIITIGLLSLSVFCVAVIIFKFLLIRDHMKKITQAYNYLKQNPSVNVINTLSQTASDNPAQPLFMHVSQELKSVGSKMVGNVMSGQDIENLEYGLHQTIDTVVLDEEQYLPVLSASAVVSPLVGLFGTIWGLIQAFIDIGQERTADIATVAPGIAMALITTLSGLVVAIPAMVFYHYFSNELRKIETILFKLGDVIIHIVENHHFN